MIEGLTPIYEFVIVTAGIWLFVHLTFGFGTFKEAAMITLIGTALVALLSGATIEVFGALMLAGGMLSMSIYKIRFAQASAMVITFIFLGFFLFRFSG
ncbi:MAG: hypothetical protein AABX01_05095 [Candidatus Micrarchaeota archaeon]